MTKTILSCLLVVFAGAVWGQGGAPRNLHIVVPFPPGGVGDVVARTLAGPLGKSLGQPVVVENKPGATSVVGTDYVARAPADGNMLLLCFNSFSISPAVRAKLPYDALRDFSGVSKVGTTPLVFAVSATSPWKSFSELLGQARTKPGSVAYGTPGQAGAQHLAIESFKQTAKVELVHVPYQGAAPAVTALLGGHVSSVVVNVPDVVPHVQSGRLRALAVTSASRSPALSDVPTVAESGFPGYEAELWIGIVTQRAVAAERVKRLNGALTDALRQPEVVESFAKLGLTPTPTTPEQFDAFVRAEIVSNQTVARQANLRVE
jgi:tripartite-type tricarboxylate transporter receptor subunit TctC